MFERRVVHTTVVVPACFMGAGEKGRYDERADGPNRALFISADRCNYLSTSNKSFSRFFFSFFMQSLPKSDSPRDID